MHCKGFEQESGERLNRRGLFTYFWGLFLAIPADKEPQALFTSSRKHKFELVSIIAQLPFLVL